MRRRSASALSTAAERLVSSCVTCGGVRLLGARAEQRLGQGQLHAAHADGDPRGDDHEAEDPGDRARAPRRRRR